ncbi:MAG: sodium:solute symporter family protein [Acidobacteria bacterium]|nr:sodium:solute symporter family protein [Acidobacteriota bacterium]
MTQIQVALLFLALYVGLTYWLSWLGGKKTKDLKGFSIGNRDMSPVLVGITCAASIASSATFLINPGFVYTHGWSAYVHFGLAAYLGLVCALAVLTKAFHRNGTQLGALTIPDWVFRRFQNRGLALFFAGVNLLSIAFVVLILVGCAILLATLFGIGQKLALVLVLLFVFSYVLIGGTYAHAYTNAVQGIMMAMIALFLFGQGWFNMEGGFWHNLSAQGSDYAAWFNPSSNLYHSFFSVMLSSFLITFALMLQPHIMTKMLYLRSEQDTRTFLTTTFVFGAIFSLVLFVGFFAKFKGMEIPRQDQVVATYLVETFSQGGGSVWILGFISVALLAAGMSTLDGILVALSAMVVRDIVHPFFPSSNAQSGLVASRWVLVGIGLVSLGLAWNPPKLVGLFAQQGVYGLAASLIVPVLFGLFSPRRVPVFAIAIGSGLSLTLHLLLNLVLDLPAFKNPSVSAATGILVGLGITALILWFQPRATSVTSGSQTKPGSPSGTQTETQRSVV